MKTIIVWFRNDLRVNDHPALATAASEGDRIIPLFILNERLLTGENSSSNRNRFLLECLTDLKESLQKLGNDLVIRSGSPIEVLQSLISEHQAESVFYTADYTPNALKRDKAVKSALTENDITFRGFPGRLIVSSFDKLHTKSQSIYKVFTPFYKNWQTIERRQLGTLPAQLPALPTGVPIGVLPTTENLTDPTKLSPDVLRGGETAARSRLETWLKNGIADYQTSSNDLGIDGTSRLSSYLHFGCLSPLEAETMLPENNGAAAWNRQLAWRDFYNYIIFNFPGNADQEFQERFRALEWSEDPEFLAAWEQGRTGYPIIDASMRQLLQEGWMHNRARLIVGSFLTKDLWIDWRLGERHFMHWLIDGDQANNNGNWQWITSVGVDPAPIFRRLYNPGSQQQKHDPAGAYIYKYVPELAKVPAEHLAEPWKMTVAEQSRYGCIIGRDYPTPIVDHATARLKTLERFRDTAPK